MESLLAVVGPTASGKSSFAVRLAEQLGGEIVSADSVQVYRYFDIGSGKPTPEELARVPHHLIDVADPDQPLDAASWSDKALAVVAQIRARGRVPIVCGGTYLWVRSLVYGLVAAPPADPAIRERHRLRAFSAGREALHRDLAAVDPASATRLNANDFVRVSRALEVFELTGKALSAWHAEHGFRSARFAARLIGVERGRDELDLRIKQRIHAMLKAGWVEEVRSLIERGYGNTRAMASVGYRQIETALRSAHQVSEAELEQQIYRTTRVFARRQRTWLREEPVTWVSEHDAAGQWNALMETLRSERHSIDTFETKV
jgi:tRNA dimethylallyltransferase